MLGGRAGTAAAGVVLALWLLRLLGQRAVRHGWPVGTRTAATWRRGAVWLGQHGHDPVPPPFPLARGPDGPRLRWQL